MSLLFRVIYAAHANGTHHKLALDAVRALEGPDADAWQRLFLKHAETYLVGSKAPDVTFKDFKNHVLHVKDGYWGGAIDATATWYQRLVDDLRAARWADAVYSAGVLSHYVVDPIHPFHTGQSDAESNIHRAVEWSISKSYDGLRALPQPAGAVDGPALSSGPDWLKQLICASAEHAHHEYHTLLVHYDIHAGVVDPPAGLDARAKATVASLLAYAERTYAAVLGRALDDAGVSPPEVSLTVDTILATLQIPKKWLLNKISDRNERRQVEAMYDELMATGKVEHTLTEDDRTIRNLYATEVAAPKAERQASARTEKVSSASPTPAGKPIAPAVATRARLDAAAPVEAAPSIGPKTAERLAKVGIVTVADLLAADPENVATGLAAHHITPDTVRAWQDQAHLVMTLPKLNGTHAQLLVGAGFRSPAAIGSLEAKALADDMSAFARTEAGARILRDTSPPGPDVIAQWIDAARSAMARAA